MAEALVALLLLVLIVSSSRLLFATQSRVGLGLTERGDLLETWRVVRTLLREELRSGHPDLDWVSVTRDSLALRVFRGVGQVCGRAGVADELSVSVRGIRLPEAGKDSLLVLGVDGAWRIADLVGRSAAPTSACGVSDGARTERWKVDRRLPPSVLARYFERGSYHLAGGALRYRRERGGRQPVTAVRVDSASHFVRVHRRGVAVDLWLTSPGWIGRRARRESRIWAREPHQ